MNTVCATCGDLFRSCPSKKRVFCSRKCYEVEWVKRRTRHGHSWRGGVTPTYSSWKNMLHRCTNHSNRHYRHYGGRGIKVCDRWMSFGNFLSDMGERQKGLTLDRIDVDGNYEPTNCRWATQAIQCLNKRPEFRAHTRICKQCGELFKSSPSDASRSGHGQFCSKRCWYVVLSQRMKGNAYGKATQYGKRNNRSSS